jgi:hypothetical protein
VPARHRAAIWSFGRPREGGPISIIEGAYRIELAAQDGIVGVVASVGPASYGDSEFLADKAEMQPATTHPELDWDLPDMSGWFYFDPEWFTGYGYPPDPFLESGGLFVDDTTAEPALDGFRVALH